MWFCFCAVVCGPLSLSSSEWQRPVQLRDMDMQKHNNYSATPGYTRLLEADSCQVQGTAARQHTYAMEQLHSAHGNDTP